MEEGGPLAGEDGGAATPDGAGHGGIGVSGNRQVRGLQTPCRRQAGYEATWDLAKG